MVPKETASDATPKTVRRLMQRHLDRALAGLREPSDDDGVHEARKRIKRMRAFVRLLRDVLGPEAYRRLDRSLRDAGRALAAQRDLAARSECLGRLEAWKPEALPEAQWHAVREALSSPSADTSPPPGGPEVARGILTDIAEELRANRWDATGRSSSVAAGIARTYRRGRKTFEELQAKPHPDGFHVWRKDVKYQAHQIQVIEVGPAMRRRRRRLETLAEVLGDAHDLSEVLDALGDFDPATRERIGAAQLEALAVERVQELHASAMELGARLFRHKPSRVRRRFERS